MSLIRIAATAVFGLFLSLAPASAAPISPTSPQKIRPLANVERTRYRHYNDAAVGEAIIGGILSGAISGALGDGCYYAATIMTAVMPATTAADILAAAVEIRSPALSI